MQTARMDFLVVKKNSFRGLGLALAVWMLAFSSYGAILQFNFDDGYQGWEGFGDLNVEGSSPPGTLDGSFAAGPPPPSGTFGSPLMGTNLFNLSEGGTLGITQISFAFYANVAVPSSLLLSFGNDTDGFITAAISAGSFLVGQANNVVVTAANWTGATGNMLNIVENAGTYFDLLLTAGNQPAPQTFALDNFTITLGEVQPPSAIPEPGVVNLLLFAVIMGLVVRRRFFANPGLKPSNI